MRFEGLKLAKFIMYNGWVVGVWIAFAWMLLYPIALGKGFMFFELFERFFLSDIRLTLLFSGLIMWSQLEGFLNSRTKPKFLEILSDKSVFHLLSGKVFEFKYSELSSLELTKDIFKIFEFTFKDGRKQKISNSIKNKDLALKIIQEKISEAKNQ